jgi:iron complex transport system ATP-binding protein
LQLSNAQVVRDGRTILAVDEFRIFEGEHIAVLGPNGAGKSTLIKLLTRDVLPLWVDPPPVLFRGRERIALQDARALLGVVSADAQEQANVVVRALEIVLGGLYGSLGVPIRVTPSPALEQRAMAALGELEVSQLAERTMNTLSTGEARRVLIARALVHDPAVLVLDEPCAGLDPHAAYNVRLAMRSLAQGGRSIALVTHHVEDIVPEIERVVLVQDSRIVADGPKREVLTSERLGELFDIPAVLEERDGHYRLW